MTEEGDLEQNEKRDKGYSDRHTTDRWLGWQKKRDRKHHWLSCHSQLEEAEEEETFLDRWFSLLSFESDDFLLVW